MYAYVTLVTNHDYAIGARALGRSLSAVGAHWPRVAMVTPGVQASDLELLESSGWQISTTEQLQVSEPFRARHTRQAQHAASPFSKGEKPLFHDPLDNFCKLRLWQMTQFERVVFLDADTLVIHNIDRLFGYPEFSGAPNLYESLADMHRLNSGVFVAQPSQQTFASMLAALDAPDAYWPRTDQTFLQSYFPLWHGLPYTFNALQYLYFNLPQLWNWDAINVIHYQYEKPWQPQHGKADLLRPLIELWQEVDESGQLPAAWPGPQP